MRSGARCGGRVLEPRRRVLGHALFATTASVLLHGATAAGLRLGEALDLEVVGATLSSRYGLLAAARVGLLGALLPLLLAALQPPTAAPGRSSGTTRRWLLLAAVPLLLGIVVTVSLAGHAGSGPAAPLGLAADGLHLAAVSLWLGGLAVLLTVVLPRRDPLELRQVLSRFSRLAFAAVVVIVATGLVQSWRQVATLDALAATHYGRLLLAKVTLVALLLAAAAVSRSLVHRRLLPTSALVARPDGPGAARLDPDRDTVPRLRRSVGIKIAIAIAVLALTAALVATNPARQAADPAAAAPAAAAER
jgi:copper transport protein